MTGSPDDGWHFIGKHAIRFEPPDLILNRPDGDMSVEQHLQVLRFVQSLPQPEKGFFALINARKGGRVDPEAFKLPEIRHYSQKHRGVAYFNASFYHRTIIDIFQRVNRLLKFAPTNIPLKIFDTEGEARAWIDEIRKRG